MINAIRAGWSVLIAHQQPQPQSPEDKGGLQLRPYRLNASKQLVSDSTNADDSLG